jgi:hypothetical protein
MHVALKIIGIYALIQSIPLLGAFIQTSSIVDDEFVLKPLAVIGTVVPFGLMIVSGLCLTIFSKKVADRMFPVIKSENRLTETSSDYLHSIAISIVGLLLMVFSIPHLADIIWNYHAMKNAGDEMPMKSLLDKNWNYALRSGVQFLMGFLMFISSRVIATLWRIVVNRITFESKI